MLHMAAKFLTRSWHGTIYYFRRRVPVAVQHIIDRQVIVVSLATSDRRFAVVRGRVLAVQTNAVFQNIVIAAKPYNPEDITFGYELKLDFTDFGKPSSLYVKTEPEEQDAVNSSIRAAIDGR